MVNSSMEQPVQKTLSVFTCTCASVIKNQGVDAKLLQMLLYDESNKSLYRVAPYNIMRCWSESVVKL